MQSNHEVIVPNKDLPFKMFLFEGEHGNYFRDKHWHRSIEIFAVFEGSLRFHLNDNIYSLTPNQFILVNSNEIHAIDAYEPNKTVVVQIPFKTFSDYFTGEQYIRFTHTALSQDIQMIELIREMYTNYMLRHTGYDFKVQRDFYMLLYLLVTVYRELDVSDELLKQNKKLNKLSPVTNYIRDHYQDEISLEFMAEKFGYAPAYLSRIFQKYAGINFKDYVRSVRIENAYAELSTTEHTISEIALNNGFPDSRAFSKLFKKKYGLLPSEFIRQK